MKKDKLKRLQRIEESLENIHSVKPDAAFLKNLEQKLITHKAEAKRVSLAITFAAAASLALLFGANLYVLSFSDSGQNISLSERTMIEEYNLYPATIKSFGNE